MTSTAPTAATRQVAARPARADVREAIITAATAEFLHNGYAAVSVDQLAARAGFTKGAVYSNFGGKPELFAAVCARNYRLTSTAIGPEAIAEVERSGRAAVGRVAAELAQTVVRTAGWHVLMAEFRALAGRDERVATVYATLRDSRRDTLAGLLRDAGIRPPTAAHDPYRVAAVLLLGTMSQLALEYVSLAPEPAATEPPVLVTEALAALIESWTA